MESRCKNCTLLLSSNVEKETEYCFDCIKKIVKHEGDADNQRIELNELLKRSEQENSILKSQNEKFLSLMKAEMEGVSAADRGFPEEQNPYPDGEMCVMWLNGHQSVETRRRTAQASAVIGWASQSLATIQELAKGYGQPEISDKIETVVEKLKPFQGG